MPMLQDRYGYLLSTTSTAARDAYVEAVDLFLSAEEGVTEAFGKAVEHDPNFALAHIGLARQHQMVAQPGKIPACLDAANSAEGLSDWEKSHIEASTLLLSGKAGQAYPKIRAHMVEHPRDALLGSTCMGVFGLIGFSGQPGREAECLAFSTSLAPHYGDDWWFLGVHSFAQMEAGQIGPAERSVEKSLAQRPTSANGAHYRSHLYYENGEGTAGYNWIRDWIAGYSRAGVMHTHISWHVALWALEQGEQETLWNVVDTDVMPDVASGPPINVVTDMASILYRAELAGLDGTQTRWKAVSDYTAKVFPKLGLGFVDVHAALAHAMAGDGERLERIITEARGLVADLVRELAEAFRAIAAENWQEAEAHLAIALADHARIGGSRAQRDLIEYAMASVLMRQGQTAEARRLLAVRRPVATTPKAVKGLEGAA